MGIKFRGVFGTRNPLPKLRVRLLQNDDWNMVSVAQQPVTDMGAINGPVALREDWGSVKDAPLSSS